MTPIEILIATIFGLPIVVGVALLFLAATYHQVMDREEAAHAEN